MIKYKRMNKMGGLRDYIISALLVGLFFVVLINFINIVSVDNGGNSVLTDPVINASFSNMVTNLSAISGNNNGTAQQQLNATTSQTLDTSFGNMVLTSIGGAWTAFTGSVTGIYNIIMVLLIQKLGIPVLILNVLAGTIIISLIFFGWRMIRLGT